jgi:hypothetical protein
MKTHKISIKSADIPEERIRELSAAPFPKKPPSEEERKIYIKRALIWLLITVVIAAVGFVITYVLHRRIRGVVAFLFAAITLCVAVGDFAKLFKDIRQTSPKAALRQYLDVILLGDDSDKFTKKSLSYAYSSLCRLIPDSVLCTRVDFENYVGKFRKDIERKHNEGYDDVFLKDFNVNDNAVARIECVKIDEKSGADCNFCNGVFTVVYAEQTTNKAKSGTLSKTTTEAKEYARFEVTFEVLLVKSGKYYFFADPMPEINFANEEKVVQV